VKELSCLGEGNRRRHRFLRKVEPGAADRSYGIEVAKLAGLPNEVIARAREVLAEHDRPSASLPAIFRLAPRLRPGS